MENFKFLLFDTNESDEEDDLFQMHEEEDDIDLLYHETTYVEEPYYYDDEIDNDNILLTESDITHDDLIYVEQMNYSPQIPI
jgi:hypothetical protein